MHLWLKRPGAAGVVCIKPALVDRGGLGSLLSDVYVLNVSFGRKLIASAQRGAIIKSVLWWFVINVRISILEGWPSGLRRLS